MAARSKPEQTEPEQTEPPADVADADGIEPDVTDEQAQEQVESDPSDPGNPLEVATVKGFDGYRPDETPLEAYTLQGVIASEAAAQADATATDVQTDDGTTDTEV